jgi:hypothetical protein
MFKKREFSPRIVDLGHQRIAQRATKFASFELLDDEPGRITTKPGRKWVAIYALVDTLGMVRYVGKTSGGLSERLITHRKYPTNYMMAAWFETGEKIEIRAIEYVRRPQWEESERYWIRYFRDHGTLLNIAAGGKHKGAERDPEEEEIAKQRQFKRRFFDAAQITLPPERVAEVHITPIAEIKQTPREPKPVFEPKPLILPGAAEASRRQMERWRAERGIQCAHSPSSNRHQRKQKHNPPKKSKRKGAKGIARFKETGVFVSPPKMITAAQRSKRNTPNQ